VQWDVLYVCEHGEQCNYEIAFYHLKCKKVRIIYYFNCMNRLCNSRNFLSFSISSAVFTAHTFRSHFSTLLAKASISFARLNFSWMVSAEWNPLSILRNSSNQVKPYEFHGICIYAYCAWVISSIPIKIWSAWVCFISFWHVLDWYRSKPIPIPMPKLAMILKIKLQDRDILQCQKNQNTFVFKFLIAILLKFTK
jgi:hypothetical protein